MLLPYILNGWTGQARAPGLQSTGPCVAGKKRTEKRKRMLFFARREGAGLSEEGGVGGEGPRQSEVLPHEHAEQPLGQGLGVGRRPRDARAQQDLPACRGREVGHVEPAAHGLPVVGPAPPRTDQVVVHGGQ